MTFRSFIARVSRRGSAMGVRATDAALGAAEPAFIASAPPPPWPPIFIIGLPRVGSTLVYQLLASGLKTSFICNAAAAIPHAPALATWALGRWHHIDPPERFESRYGVAPGWNAPAQGREIWGRWFPGDQSYVSGNAIAPAVIQEIRGTVSRIARSFHSPFINKAQGHSVRILPLCEVFPDAVFIRVCRPAADVAESILLGRRECFGDEREWFSAKPSRFYELGNLDPVRQVVGQIRGLEADMNRDLAHVGDSRAISFDYTAVCENPRAMIAAVARFYEGRTGVSLIPRRDVPQTFAVSTRRKVMAAESELFRRLLEESQA